MLMREHFKVTAPGEVATIEVFEVIDNSVPLAMFK
jgi:hypothetical protein